MVLISIEISDDNLDARERNDGSNYAEAGDMIVGNNVSNIWSSAMVFPGVTLPKTATVVDASLSIAPTSAAVHMRAAIFGEDEDDANTFTVEADLASRTKTTATVAWSADGSEGTYLVSSDLKTIVDEIQGRTGWVSGNAMCFIVWGDDPGTFNLDFFGASGDDADYAGPKLIINYTAAAGGGGDGGAAERLRTVRIEGFSGRAHR